MIGWHTDRVLLSGALDVVLVTASIGIIGETFIALFGNTFFMSYVGSLVLINMKEAGGQSVNAGTSCGMGTMSDINFADGMGEQGQEGIEGEMWSWRVMVTDDGSDRLKGNKQSMSPIVARDQVFRVYRIKYFVLGTLLIFVEREYLGV